MLFWYEPLQCALEISSMGIRVDENSLVEQLKKENCEDRLNLPYHQAIVNKELPYTIGGGNWSIKTLYVTFKSCSYW